MNCPKVAVVILNWNGWQDTIACLESLLHIDYPNWTAIIVDNGSSDGSANRIREWLRQKQEAVSVAEKASMPSEALATKPSQGNAGSGTVTEISLRFDDGASGTERKLVIVEMDANLGFAEGCNTGMRLALHTYGVDYCLLLNNDVVVEKSFLSRLVSAIQGDPLVGIAGSKIMDYRRPDLVQFAGGRIIWALGEIRIRRSDRRHVDSKTSSAEVDVVSGCSMLIPRSTLEDVGFLSPDYFLYYEDTDYCIRVRRSGLSVLYVSDSLIWHKLSTSSRKHEGMREYYATRNAFVLARKHATKMHKASFAIYFLVIRIWITLSIVIILHRNPGAAKPLLRGLFEGLWYFAHGSS